MATEITEQVTVQQLNSLLKQTALQQRNNKSLSSLELEYWKHTDPFGLATWNLDEFFGLPDAQHLLTEDGPPTNKPEDSQTLYTWLNELQSLSRPERLLAARNLLNYALGDFKRSGNGRLDGVRSSEELLDRIRQNNRLLHVELDSFAHYSEALYDSMKRLLSLGRTHRPNVNEANEINEELDLYLTLLYLSISCNVQEGNIRKKVQPNFVGFLFHMIDFINLSLWNARYPLRKLCILLSLSLTVLGGGLGEIDETKNLVRSIYGLLPTDTNSKHFKNTIDDKIKLKKQKPKIMPREFERELDDLCKHYPGLIPEPSPYRNPYFTLLTKYDPTQFPRRLTSSQSLKAANGEAGAGAEATSEAPLGSPSAGDSPPLILCIPAAISESIKIYSQHMYISLSSIELSRERKYQSDPHSCLPPKHSVFDELSRQNLESRFDQDSEKIYFHLHRLENVDKLFRKLYPELTGLIVTLLKIILAVATPQQPPSNSNSMKSSGTSQTKSGGSLVAAVNNMLNVHGASKNNNSVSESAQSGLELSRNREIIGKHISLILLLMMKQFRVCNALLFEHICQVMVDSNCILLVLKILTQDTKELLLRPPDLPFQLFTEWFLDLNQLNANAYNAVEASIEKKIDVGEGDDGQKRTCERNLCMFINILRILQKLVKRRDHRIRTLLAFKAQISLKKALAVSHPVLDFYLFKNFKNLLSFMPRKWRQSHMKIIAGIYSNVRPEFCTDWIRYQDPSSLLKESQVADQTMRNLVSTFIKRQYERKDGTDIYHDQVISEDDIELDPLFMENYEIWLEENVYSVVEDQISSTIFSNNFLQSDLSPKPSDSGISGATTDGAKFPIMQLPTAAETTALSPDSDSQSDSPIDSLELDSDPSEASKELFVVRHGESGSGLECLSEDDSETYKSDIEQEEAMDEDEQQDRFQISSEPAVHVDELDF